MDRLEAMTRRISTRSFMDEPAAAEELEAVRRVGERAEALTTAELGFHLCSHEQIGGEVKGIFGDYGKVIRAPHYIVCTARESAGYLIDTGYRFEQLVLEATRRDLGTCWIGGFFNEASLRATLGLGAERRVVVMTPIGRAAEGSFMGRAIRGVLRSTNRKPLTELFFWERHGAALPASVTGNERLVRILEATRRSPSWANKQPWRFVLSNSEVLLYKLSRQEKEGKDYHALDCGIAMSHFTLASRALDLPGSWELASFVVPGAPTAEPIARMPLPGGLPS